MTAPDESKIFYKLFPPPTYPYSQHDDEETLNALVEIMVQVFGEEFWPSAN
jgi:hypothetical protein